MKKELKQKSDGGARGRYRFKAYKAGTRELLRVSEWHENLVVSSSGYGLNVICRQLAGDASIPIEISEIQIGTGDTPPVAGNTGLETPVATGILRANQIIANNVVTLEFFIADLELPNGTYEEAGIFCGAVGDRRLFARSIISPAYTKGTSEDTEIEYELTFTAV